MAASRAFLERTLLALLFDMVEERQDSGRIEIGDTEGCWLDAFGLVDELQQQAKPVPVCGQGSWAGIFLVEQVLDEEGLHQSCGGYGRCRHNSTLWFAYASKRLAACLNRSGVAVRYQ